MMGVCLRRFCLFVLSWARVRLVAPRGVVPE